MNSEVGDKLIAEGWTICPSCSGEGGDGSMYCRIIPESMCKDCDGTGIINKNETFFQNQKM